MSNFSRRDQCLSKLNYLEGGDIDEEVIDTVRDVFITRIKEYREDYYKDINGEDHPDTHSTNRIYRKLTDDDKNILQDLNTEEKAILAPVEYVRTILKDTRIDGKHLKRWLPHAYIIRLKALGIEPIKMSSLSRSMMENDIDEFIGVWPRLLDSHTDFINYGFLINRVLNRNKMYEYFGAYRELSDLKLEYCFDIWRRACEELGWDYIGPDDDEYVKYHRYHSF